LFSLFGSLLRTLFFRRKLEDDLHDELTAYSELLQAEGRTSLRPSDLQQIKEGTREVRVGEWLVSLGRDVMYGVRTLRRSPTLTGVAIVALALGIGANTALFSLVKGVLLRPLPYPQADRVAVLYMNFIPQNNPRGNLSMADFLDWRERNHAFD